VAADHVNVESQEMAQARIAVHFLAMFALAFLGDYLGNGVANFIYYDILNLTDPYPGPTATRMVLSSTIIGSLIWVLTVGYAAIFQVAGRFTLLAVIYSLFGAVAAIGHAQTVGGFSLEDGFWLYEFFPFVLILLIPTSIYYYLKHGRFPDPIRR